MDVRTFTGGPFVQNTYVVECSDGASALLVDAGSATPQALDEIEAKGLRVEAILLTHAHLDHIDGLAEAQRRTQAPVYLHPADRVLFDNAASQAAMFGVPFETPEPPDHELVPGETLVVGGESFDVRFAPGHAPGHVIFVSESSPVALVGDVIFAGSIGRTDLPGGDYQ
ncbi:MAG: MBL fold metallo-hydrolase, partial [Longimicrobiales bacterium]